MEEKVRVKIEIGVVEAERIVYQDRVVVVEYVKEYHKEGGKLGKQDNGVCNLENGVGDNGNAVGEEENGMGNLALLVVLEQLDDCLRRWVCCAPI